MEPYDHNNCFNIWSNNLKLRKKNLDLEKSLKDTMRRMGSSSGKDEETLARELQTIDKETKDMVKGVQFKIRRLHIRYEDDYYSADKPYSFGLVFDVSHKIIDSSKTNFLCVLIVNLTFACACVL